MNRPLELWSVPVIILLYSLACIGRGFLHSVGL
jgi:hypothetical protein